MFGADAKFAEKSIGNEKVFKLQLSTWFIKSPHKWRCIRLHLYFAFKEEESFKEESHKLINKQRTVIGNSI